MNLYLRHWRNSGKIKCRDNCCQMSYYIDNRYEMLCLAYAHMLMLWKERTYVKLQGENYCRMDAEQQDTPLEHGGYCLVILMKVKKLHCSNQ